MRSSVLQPESAPYPIRRAWTRDEFERAGELGLFDPEERLELIDGEVLTQMTQKSPHATSVQLTVEVLRSMLPPGLHVRMQLPLALSDRSQPDPDAAVVTGTIRDYATSHPSTAALVIEVSDTSLRFDRAIKAGLYAGAGIPEYWIVNVTDRILEVRRQPAARVGRPRYYRSVRRCAEEESATALLLPGVTVRVADLLP